jgi:holo-[acyl-carrier protein] synthase
MNNEQILGLGMDLVEINRIQQSLDRFGDRFLEKIFHPAEIEYARTQSRPAVPLAARFAAKEALYKALSPSHGLHWHDAEVINQPNGKPEFLFRGEIADLVDGANVHLSLSHDAGIASAMVVVER